MELRHDDALGAVHHEGAVTGHQRDLAEVNFLLLDVFDRAASALNVPDDELDFDLDRRRESHPALMAFLDIVLRSAEVIADEFQRRGFVEILNRKNRFENRLKSLVLALIGTHVRLEEFLVGTLLYFDQVRDLDDLLDFPERTAKAKIAGDLRLSSHRYPLGACRSARDAFTRVHTARGEP